MLIKNQDGRVILLKMVRAIQENKDYLSEIDGMIGDGDHGINMNKGFTMYQEQLAEKPVRFTDGLADLGLLLLNQIGGSMGPIYGTIFLSMSESADNADEITLQTFSSMMENGLRSLYDIVDARPGDKTLVDTLYPACRSIKESSDQQLSFTAALDAMKAAAASGMVLTRNLTAKYGRASRLGERSRGVLDAGAVSCCILLSAMADGMLEVMLKED
ncbi:dihydroxyacetone kinase subunit DhaL [Diplocloster hominis]|uniref:dihydroxyacetone kinase subunit DhaL n=1 Tax=Diplocloster hominis TaxID=3079010 RepID=UPI0031BA63E9